MRTLLSNRDAVNLAQARRFVVGTLSTDQAENVGEVIYVDGTAGSNAYDGKSPDRAKATIAGGLAVAVAGDVVAVLPGTYAEHVTMAVANVSLVGLGDVPRQVLLSSAVDLATPYINITASGCVVANLRISNLHANNVNGITITASNTLIEGCELYRDAAGAVAQDVGIALVGPNTNINNTIRNCKFDFCTNSIIFTANVSQALGTTIEGCTFTNTVTTDIFDVTDVAVDYLKVIRCDFLGAPTKFIEVDSAACVGGSIVECCFLYATHAAAVIDIDNGILCIANRTVAGISTAAPA